MRPKLFLPTTPATREQTCICCHIVRNCKQCCNRCPAPCSLQYDCQLKLEQTCEWWNNLARILDWDVVQEYLPSDLLGYANKHLIEH